jgi:2-oxoacid:acceptor oxidoreductase gamma subunit (pyruvate/2-ketoisovalerate family)/2-oxoacid:acceptor oxidoreductase delta subunit (pyruvate/2-ketoisovalerate family)
MRPRNPPDSATPPQAHDQGMQEMLLTGRGGEGVVLASQILADTFARAGYWVQSFPEFKAERRGAPISAFLRWDDAPIRRRYKVRECDVLVAISASPPPAQSVALLRPGGLLLVNRDSRFPHHGDYRIARVPGSQVARRNRILSAEGRPMGNVAVLGAAVRLLLPDGLNFLEDAIRARMGGALAEPNVVAAREGYRSCTIQHAAAADTPYEPAEATQVRPPLPRFAVSLTTSRVNHTGTWSVERPILLEACNVCGLCALFCPEGAMRRVDGAMEIDLDYCKGCGICEDVCPVRNAIAMEEVPA